MKMKFLLMVVVFAAYINLANGQNNRLNTSNTIGWYNYFGTIKLDKKWSIHTEYQWRRNNLITNWQQSLLRLGVNYQASKGLLLRLGYGWIETFPYGEYPLNGFGKDFTEHRIFQMAQLTHKEAKVDISHRFMLEQRFVGKYNAASSTKEESFPLLHRIRYMARLQTPLGAKAPNSYAALYDEVFVGFGKNVNANVFDQNRLGILLGHKFNQWIKIEGGYLHQIVQYGRQIGGKNVFQYNKGIIVNCIVSIAK